VSEKKRKKEGKKRETKISLYPLSPEEALRKLLQIPPPEKKKKARTVK